MSYKQYRRTGVAEMRPYVKGESTLNISVSAPDFAAGLANDMGMIARNPGNHEDQWYVARKYFDENFEEVTS